MHRIKRTSVIASTLLLGLTSLVGLVPVAQASQRYEANGKDHGPAMTRLDLGGRGAGPSLFAAPQAQPANPQPTTPECPPELANRCHLSLAAYVQNNPNDKSDYGNFDLSNRPTGGLNDLAKTSMAINTIVIHDTEGSLSDTLAAFQNPTFYASAHYVIDSDGSIYQTVPLKDIAWHAGNWYVNQHSIGIEHVGHAVNGGTEYTQAMYNSSVLLVRWLSTKYHIPLDRQHILGHDNVPAPTTGLIAGMHWDPGTFWNWEYYQNALSMPPVISTGTTGQLITIAPHWMINQPVVANCPTDTTCTNLPNQPANFVYLRSQPVATAPLLTDPNLPSIGGTTRIDDWAARATYGQQFAVAARQGDWVGIYYGGQNSDGSAKIGWFENPYGLLNAWPTKGSYLTPKAGLASIPVYGRAYPEASAYAGSQVPVQTIAPLNYTIGAGEKYASGGLVPVDYQWDWTIDASLPDDHTTIIGQDKYYEIQFNHRVAYVKASDVTSVPVQ
ncbi:MAG TPA: peptidoglycan recognition family protein [Candidatus Saccharimonadia bacterium]